MSRLSETQVERGRCFSPTLRAVVLRFAIETATGSIFMRAY